MQIGAPFDVDRDHGVDNAIERGDPRDATSSECRTKAIIFDVTHADPQAKFHMRAGALIEMDKLPPLPGRETTTTMLV